MHKIVEAASITCNACGKTFEDVNGVSIYQDDDAALDAATLGGWWCDGYGHHYCKKDTTAAKKEAKAAGIYSD